MKKVAYTICINNAQIFLGIELEIRDEFVNSSSNEQLQVPLDNCLNLYDEQSCYFHNKFFAFNTGNVHKCINMEYLLHNCRMNFTDRYWLNCTLLSHSMVNVQNF